MWLLEGSIFILQPLIIMSAEGVMLSQAIFLFKWKLLTTETAKNLYHMNITKRHIFNKVPTRCFRRCPKATQKPIRISSGCLSRAITDNVNQQFGLLLADLFGELVKCSNDKKARVETPVFTKIWPAPLQFWDLSRSGQIWIWKKLK